MKNEAAPLLEVVGLHAGYGPTEVLHGINLRVCDGEIVTVLGANGAGKSTLLMSICGVVRARSGVVRFDGEPIHHLPTHEIVQRGIAQVPEGRRIFPRLTVRENLELGGYVRGATDELERMFELFPILRERQRQLGGTLSGGEQQMLAIARALMAQPRLLLLDEPSLGLAPRVVIKIFEIITEINRRGTAILLVEQNANMALHVAHRGYVLETGRVVLEDTATALIHNDQVKRSYLGG
ncbi:MAG: ABC transporter ATP-binding protein [Verrucomicrobiae bacterium]|nr:ABC transporter ATP-binding protein [Verrucomicrobiae bacterium]